MRLLLLLFSTTTMMTAFPLVPRETVHHMTRQALSSSSSSSSQSDLLNTFPHAASLTRPICEYHILTIPVPEASSNRDTSSSSSSAAIRIPQQEIHVMDVTPQIRNLLHTSGMQHGVLTVTSRHTTTGITINEQESRLARDLRQWLWQLAPPDERSFAGAQTSGIRYQHNDLEQRPESLQEEQRCLENGWNIHDPVQLQAWRDQEPINAHSHLAAMLLGTTESIPVSYGKMTLGSWQSVLMVDLDGPRERTVGVQVMGYL